ncbi:MAG: DUF3910 family protein [Ectobacillus sp.]
MDTQAKIDWIGTPRRHSYEENRAQHFSMSVDFTLEQDDNRYKLIMQTVSQNGRSNTTYEIKQYGTKPGAQKPFIIDTGYTFKNETIPLIEAILQDPYVASFL